MSDGRAARAQRTRAAIIESLLGLLEAGDLSPSVDAIAARAGVSSRSVFQHFGDQEGLFAALGEAQAGRVKSVWEPSAPAVGSLEERCAALAAQRRRIYELILPVRRAALLREGESPVAREGLQRFRALKRADVVRVLHVELGGDARLEAAAGALASMAAWQAMRDHAGLDADAAEAAIATGLLALARGAASARDA